MALHTTDGGQFTYLVKGLEDLRLDQRVLQWMQAASDALQRASGRRPHGASTAASPPAAVAVHLLKLWNAFCVAGMWRWQPRSPPGCARTR